ncbi:MAG TPA: response regulator transcription factor, partial [Candidatus Dormibacteraeota bacterium]|nr:response regulator transcription factor [Candidatus Dormibacteraeota bacterium]
MRGGFRMILEAQPDITVVGEAGDGLEAVEEAGRLSPDVVIMDIRMPHCGGFLLKDATPEELVHAVRVVAAGDALLAPSVT